MTIRCIASALFSLRGRMSREGIWFGTLGLAGFAGAYFTLHKWVCGQQEPSWTESLATLAWLVLFMWINLSIHVRRWHDRGKSGGMILIALIPLIGPVWTVGELFFLPGQAGPNSYGADPDAASADGRPDVG